MINLIKFLPIALKNAKTNLDAEVDKYLTGSPRKLKKEKSEDTPPKSPRRPDNLDMIKSLELKVENLEKYVHIKSLKDLDG